MSQIKQKNMKKKYWKSIQDKNNSNSLDSFIQNEFPSGTVELAETMTRKKFLSLMGASMAMAGLVGCRKPVQKILPYIQAPEEIVPGIPNYYASSIQFGMNSFGIVVESHEGRPTHIEGNKLHSTSKGGTNPYIQASILDLYDPDRIKKPYNGENETTIDNFKSYVKDVSKIFKSKEGEGLAVLSNSFRSPTTKNLYEQFKLEYPKSDWVAYDSISQENQITGIQSLINNKVLPIFQFNKADIVLSIDSDFLGSDLNSIHNQKTFSKRRKIKSNADTMNRLYSVESNLTSTGMMADHRLKIKPSDVYGFMVALNNILLSSGLKGLRKINYLGSLFSDEYSQKFLKALSNDLLEHKSKSIITIGADLDSELHSLVYLINQELLNNNQTIFYHECDDALLSNSKNIKDLIEKIKSRKIDTLLVLDIDFYHQFSHYFDKDISSLVNLIYLASHNDLTAKKSFWTIPKSHYLESWGDATSIDGTASVVQPLIHPLHKSLSVNEFISLFLSNDETDYNILISYWKANILTSSFSSKWRKTIHDGYLAESTNSNKYKVKKINQKIIATIYTLFNKKSKNINRGSVELRFSPSNQIYDGRFMNNYWLREVSDSVTKISWENVALISHKTAKKYHLDNSDIVQIKGNNLSLEIPVWILPGIVDDTIILEMGYGRIIDRDIDRNYIEEEVSGVNVLPLKDIFTNFSTSTTISKTGKKQKIACTQDHHGLDFENLAADEVENRLPEIIRESTLDDFKKNEDFVLDYDRKKHIPDNNEDMPSMYPSHDYSESPQWGMNIDLNVCSGCNACSVACQSENNIPVVGKQQVYDGREMSWIRMDRYFKGDIDNPEFALQPVACLHCENAPCEQVCPVAATTHDKEGLNGMAYNRCIGTRYCANNCPYKVRRFNFYNYTYDTPEIVQMSNNPDVSIRFRGVMEKCTYCVQRISEAKITAKNERRSLVDGDVKVACQSACPMDAITFGDITDSNSEVSKAKAQSQDYSLLKELNTLPRTTYLAKFRNPHPDLVDNSTNNNSASTDHH